MHFRSGFPKSKLKDQSSAAAIFSDSIDSVFADHEEECESESDRPDSVENAVHSVFEYFDETLSKYVVSILILLPSGTTKEKADVRFDLNKKRLILSHAWPIDVANAKKLFANASAPFRIEFAKAVGEALSKSDTESNIPRVKLDLKLPSEIEPPHNVQFLEAEEFGQLFVQIEGVKKSSVIKDTSMKVMRSSKIVI